MINLIKALVHRALIICSTTKLGSEHDKIKQLFMENGYPADVLLFCNNQKLANFVAEKICGPEKCPVYQNCPGLVTFHQSLKIKLVKPLHLVPML